VNQEWANFEAGRRTIGKAKEMGFCLDPSPEGFILIRSTKQPYVNMTVVFRASTFSGAEAWLLGYEQREFELKTGGEVK
jgi:hypothetical protein